MARLVTPVGILITVALLALYGVYAAWIGVSQHSLTSALSGVLAFIACVGAALLKPWSRYLVYLLSAVLIGTWCYSLYTAASAGYFSLYTASQIFRQLAPGIFLAVLASFCAYAVFRQFRTQVRKP
jgi:hypothetical protein